MYHLSSQTDTVLEPLCRQESFVGKAEFFDRIGTAAAQDKTGRNTDTPNLNIDHTRRMVTTITREWGTMVDRKDKLQNIHMPENIYAQKASEGLARRKDQVLIEAAFGVARTGEDGSSSTALGNAQKVTAVDAGVLAYPNVQLLRKAKRKMDAGKVKGMRWIIHSSDFLEGLLAEQEIGSADYNTVKALVDGELDTFMGFKFLPCEEIDAYLAQSTVGGSSLDSGDYHFNATTGLYDAGGTDLGGTEKVALALAEGGLLRGETENSFIARIDERSDKGYSGQVYTAIDMGGVRMEEVKVVQLIYKA